MLRTRLVVGSLITVLLCLTIVVDHLAGWPFVIAPLAAVLAGLGAHELCMMARRTGKEPFTELAVLGAVAFVIAPCLSPIAQSAGAAVVRMNHDEPLGLILVVLLALCLLRQRLRGGLNGALVNCGMTVFTALYVGFLLSFLVRIRFLPGAGLPGVALVVFSVKAGDIGAYAIGKTCGGPKLTPLTSPNKTVTGALGGLISSTAIAVLVSLATGLFPFRSALGVGVLIGVVGQLGDLSESILKRDLDAKDASENVPGFGGVLDLLDSLLFASPAIYVILMMKGG